MFARKLFEHILYLREASKNKNDDDLLTLAQDQNTDPAQLRSLASSEDPKVVEAVAANPMTPPDVLDNLIGLDVGNFKIKEGPLHNLRFLVAQNPNTSIDKLLTLAQNGYAEHVLDNPGLSLALLENPVVLNQYPIALQNFAKSKNISPQMQRLVLQDALEESKDTTDLSNQTLKNLAQNPNIDSEVLNHIFDVQPHYAALSSKLTPDQIKELKNIDLNSTDTEDFIPDAVEAIPTESLKLKRKKRANAVLAGNSLISPKESIDILNKHANSENNYVGTAAKNALEHPGLNDFKGMKDPRDHFLNKLPEEYGSALRYLNPTMHYDGEETKSLEGKKALSNRMLQYILSFNNKPEVSSPATETLKNLINGSLYNHWGEQQNYKALEAHERMTPNEINTYMKHPDVSIKHMIFKHPFVQNLLNSDENVLDDIDTSVPNIKTDTMDATGNKLNFYDPDIDNHSNKFTLLKGDQNSRNISQNEILHPKLARFLSQSEDPEVQLNLAKNTKLHNDALHSLANSEHKEVKMNLLKNPNTRLDTINMMRFDKDSEISSAAKEAYNNMHIKNKISKRSV